MLSLNDLINKGEFVVNNSFEQTINKVVSTFNETLFYLFNNDD
jgi:hypothetical protein